MNYFITKLLLWYDSVKCEKKMILFVNLSYIVTGIRDCFKSPAQKSKRRKWKKRMPRTVSGHRMRSEILRKCFDLLEGRPFGVVLWTSTSWHIFWQEFEPDPIQKCLPIEDIGCRGEGLRNWSNWHDELRQVLNDSQSLLQDEESVNQVAIL